MSGPTQPSPSSSAQTSPRKLRIGIVAAEPSGDLLAAGLMQALKRRFPDSRFEGVGGPLMQAEGCQCLYHMEQLTLIGLGDLRKLASILRLRRRLIRHFLDNPPDLFIGVDAADFNLAVEEALRKAGVRTIQYVGPQVWAWRSYRVRAIRRAVDHLLALFPFEQDFYHRHGIPVTFVGHPLADRIPLQYDPAEFRRSLGLPAEGQIVALLPGSRRGELERHADLFVQCAQWLHARHPGLHFVAPFVDERTLALFDAALERQGGGKLPIKRLLGNSREAMAAANVVLLASGTATLEAALLRKPMVVTYRLSWLSYRMIRLFAHVQSFSLPNNLAGRPLVPEFIQSDADAEKIGPALEALLASGAQAADTTTVFARIHRELRQDASERAAEAIVTLLSGPARESLDVS